MKKKIKDTAQIQLYGVVLKEDKSKFLTIVNSVKQCREFVSDLFKLERLEHYRGWCDLRECNPEEMSNWDIYYKDCVSVDDKNQYLIVPMIYKWKDILGIMRMFGGCVPLGSSFNTDMETLYFRTKMKTLELYEQYMKDNKSEDDDFNGHRKDGKYDA